ncbi:PadR family transcriptional regulator [Paenibacillus sp. Marseille-Q4541]|uniref:PadR family transcriptional regulator n=1 Tax=Paenibacillus sp. Marseille-Q4541 TaxID=2831522 RepID=UPI001BAAE036|nr:PadR family transcriptional regulator [Paenibacillus sp. Marseille-Q4541]
MNTLGYAILSVLSRRPCSGYQLASYLDVLWPAKHSQIYPLLNKMEQNGILEFELIKQTGKPDKKIYSITDKGMQILKSWINESPNEQIKRDEFLIKVYSMWLTDEEHARKLIEDRISKLEVKIASREIKIEEVDKDHLTTTSKHFGRYVLLCRGNLLDKEEISWCNWVLDLFETPSFRCE